MLDSTLPTATDLRLLAKPNLMCLPLTYLGGVPGARGGLKTLTVSSWLFHQTEASYCGERRYANSSIIIKLLLALWSTLRVSDVVERRHVAAAALETMLAFTSETPVCINMLYSPNRLI